MSDFEENVAPSIAKAVMACEKDGYIDSENVIKAARDEKSPLHKYFEWNDTAAAHKYRIQQAQRLIRRVTITCETNEVKWRAPMYVSEPIVRDAMPGRYTSIEKIQSDEDKAREQLIDEMARVVGVADRSKRIARFLGREDVVAKIRDLAERCALDIKSDRDGAPLE